MFSIPRKVCSKLGGSVSLYILTDQMADLDSLLNSEKVAESRILVNVIRFKNRNWINVILNAMQDLETLKTLLRESKIVSPITPENPRDDLRNNFRLIVSGFVDEVSSNSGIKKTIVKYNRQIVDKDIFIFRAYVKRPPFTAIITVNSRSVYDRLIKEEVLYMGTSAVQVYRYLPNG